MQVDRRLIEQVVDEFYQASGSARMASLIMKLEDALNRRDPEPPPEAQTEAEKIAYCAGWWAALQSIIQTKIKEDSWHGLTDEERDYFKACGFVVVSRVEEVLRAKNSV